MDTKLSFFVVFRCIFEELGTVVRTVCGRCSWHFRGVEDSGENCVRSVLVVRLHNFDQVGKGDAEMFRVGCRTCDPAAPHSTSLRHFRRNRPSALWASQPSLFSCPLISTFVLQLSLFSLFFLQFFFFSPLSLLPSLLLSPFFP